jgi:hypothetical protein
MALHVLSDYKVPEMIKMAKIGGVNWANLKFLAIIKPYT